MSFRIVADSAANLWTREKGSFACVPLRIRVGEKEFVDEKGLNLEDLVEEMYVSRESCSSSCPNVFDWIDAFDGAEEIFAVTITSNLSGSYAAAVNAREEYLKKYPNAKVCILDSLSAGPEMELIVEKLEFLRDSGATFEETEKQVRAYMIKTNLLVTLESLKNLAKNGRVSNTVAKIAGVLGIRVIGEASSEGTLESIHKCRGEKKALETLKEEMIKRGFWGGKLRIAHCENLAAAEVFKEMILKFFPKSDIIIRRCKGLCSYYAERGGMIIGFES